MEKLDVMQGTTIMQCNCQRMQPVKPCKLVWGFEGATPRPPSKLHCQTSRELLSSQPLTLLGEFDISGT